MRSSRRVAAKRCSLVNLIFLGAHFWHSPQKRHLPISSVSGDVVMAPVGHATRHCPQPTHSVSHSFLPKAVATIFALLIAIVVYGVFLLIFGGLSADEIVALPKGAKIYSLLLKLHLVNEMYDEV